MAERERHAAVVGAGVSGLTTALCLLQRQITVRIYFREPPEEATSAVAPAVWHPYLSGPRHRVLAWARLGFDRFGALSDDPATGVRMVEGIEGYRVPGEEILWADIPPTLRRAEPRELPAGLPDGFIATVPLVDMRVYLGWLRRECEQRGGEFIQRSVASFDSLLTEEPLVVDCSGFGARELAGDSSVEAVRGQVVLVSAPAIATFIVDGANPEGTTYVIPRTDCVVVGGTSERGMTSLVPDAATRDAILRRASKLVPALAGAPVIGEAVGLRPARPEVRVETEVRPLGTVVHNYGHGGSGVTLSWGCAEEATALVLDALGHAEAP